LKAAEIFRTMRRANRTLIAKADRRRWESVLKATGRAEIVRMAVVAAAVDGTAVVVEAVAAAGAAADAMAAADPVAAGDGTKIFAADCRGFHG
jgi:hypothetical protein